MSVITVSALSAGLPNPGFAKIPKTKIADTQVSAGTRKVSGVATPVTNLTLLKKQGRVSEPFARIDDLSLPWVKDKSGRRIGEVLREMKMEKASIDLTGCSIESNPTERTGKSASGTEWTAHDATIDKTTEEILVKV